MPPPVPRPDHTTTTEDESSSKSTPGKTDNKTAKNDINKNINKTVNKTASAAALPKVSAMTLNQIRLELKRRRVSTVGFVEKKEFVNALLNARKGDD